MHDADIGILAGEHSSLFFATDESRELPIGVGVGGEVEPVSADITGGTSTKETIR